MADGMTEREKANERLAAEYQEYLKRTYTSLEFFDADDNHSAYVDWMKQALVARELAGTKVEGLRMAEEIAEKAQTACDPMVQFTCTEIIVGAIRSEREKVERGQ